MAFSFSVSFSLMHKYDPSICTFVGVDEDLITANTDVDVKIREDIRGSESGYSIHHYINGIDINFQF